MLAVGLAALAREPQTAVAADFCAPTISFGQTVECSLDSAGEVDSYRFQATQGDAVRVRATGTSGTLVMQPELVQPDGAIACRVPGSEVTCRLSISGTHIIRVSGSSQTGTGFYTLYLQRLTDPVGCAAVAFGALPASASIDLAGETDCFTFGAAASDRVRVLVRTPTGSTLAVAPEIAQQNGTTVCDSASTRGAGGSLTCLLRAAGRHTILVAERLLLAPLPPTGSTGPLGTGRYSVYLQRLNNPVGCSGMSLGASPLSGSLDTSDEVDCFTFVGATNDRIRLRAPATASLPSADLELVRPDGTTVCGPSAFLVGTGGASADLTCSLEETGSHTVLLGRGLSAVISPPPFGPSPPPQGSTTGRYLLYAQRLNNPIGCTPISFGGVPVAGAIDLPGELDCYTVAAAADDRFRTRAVPSSASIFATVQVTKPDGAACSTTPFTSGGFAAFPVSFGSDEALCLAETAGTYTVWVGIQFSSTFGSGTGRYGVRVQRLNGPVGCGAASYGTPASGSIERNGQQDCYVFQGSGNDRVQVTLTTTSTTLSARVQVWQPNGTPLCEQTFRGSSPIAPPFPPFPGSDLTCLLEVSGAHSVFVEDSSGRETGPYALTLTCLTGNCPIAGGTGFALRGPVPSMTWPTGTGRTGYFLVRWLPGTGSVQALPTSGPLPASATSYTDSAVPPGSPACYLLVAITASGPVISDLLCLLGRPGASPEAPQDFTILLNGSTAQLSWAPAAGPPSDGYQLRVMPTGGGSPQILSLAAGATGTAHDTRGAGTCYELTSLRAAAPVATTYALCGVSGLATASPDARAGGRAPR